MPHREDDDVIDFTPENGFVIETLAKTIVQMMRDMDMDAHVNLPGKVVVEIDKECTVQEIIKGYEEYMAARIKDRPASNKNEKKGPVSTK